MLDLVAEINKNEGLKFIDCEKMVNNLETNTIIDETYNLEYSDDLLKYYNEYKK